MNTQHKEEWPTKGRHNGFITKLELAANPNDLGLGCFEFNNVTIVKIWTESNANIYGGPDLQGITKAVQAVCPGLGFTEDVTLRGKLGIMAALVDTYGPIGISADFDKQGIRLVVGPPIAPRIKLVTVPPEAKPAPTPPVTHETYIPPLVASISFNHGRQYKAIVHRDVIKVLVDANGRAIENRPFFLTPSNGVKECSRQFATLEEAEAERRLRETQHNGGIK